MADAKSASSKKATPISPNWSVAHQATFNNTIVTFADTKGNVLSASSAGRSGFRGSKRVLRMQPKLPQKRPQKQLKQAMVYRPLTYLSKASDSVETLLSAHLATLT